MLLVYYTYFSEMFVFTISILQYCNLYMFLSRTFANNYVIFSLSRSPEFASSAKYNNVHPVWSEQGAGAGDSSCFQHQSKTTTSLRAELAWEGLNNHEYTGSYWS